MATVSVLAHTGKTLGGGLDELRTVLAREGIVDPPWYEVPKSKLAPKEVQKILKDGTDVLFVWGGDGLVQRTIDALAGADTTIAVIPAGTANLFATNLGIPKDIEGAVHVGLHGARRRLDAGTVNGERFGVMAGVGLDALMIRDMGSGLKDKVGRVGYVWTGARHLRDQQVRVKVKVDGRKWFKGKMSCVLFGNVGTVLGGLTLFPDARPDDGTLEMGVVTAKGAIEWGRALARTVTGVPDDSSFIRTVAGTTFDVRLDRKMPYELDGGERPKTKRLKVGIHPGSVTVCVPDPAVST
jgi:diacylglycerol kinase family enzyme